MKRILLVSSTPDIDISTWVNQRTSPRGAHKAFTVPLTLATLAALTPEGYEVVIWDEAVQGPVTETSNPGSFDLVGISFYSGQLSRAKKIARMFRRRGILVVGGGAGVTAEPENCREHFDVLFLGEAEETWPKFLADWEGGAYGREYIPTRLPDLSLSPKPRWDNLADSLAQCYKYGGVQINRGCPHECEFCAIWTQFGRRVRNKPTTQVIEEVAEQGRLGLRNILFCTDNFYGHPRHAREIVRELTALNRTLDAPMRFYTELSVNISRDEEFLRGLADSGFGCVFVGVESSNIESLKETRKRQNLQGDLVTQCRKIASHGVVVQAALIAGFDSDGPAIFDQHFQFLQDAAIPTPRLNVLNATPGTDLRRRLMREGRLIDMQSTFAGSPSSITDISFFSDILFKQMRRSELYSGMLGLLERVWDWRNFEARIFCFLDNIKRLPDRSPNPHQKRVAASLRENLLLQPAANSQVIERVFDHAAKVAPQLSLEVGLQLALMCWEVVRLPALKDSISRQIEIERTIEERNGYVLRLNDAPGPFTLAANGPARAVEAVLVPGAGEAE